jgi:tripartite-type tricarboxylate transporter receptor subunit TctC
MKIAKLPGSVLLCSLCLAVPGNEAVGDSVSDFYKGKQITFVISTSAGGGIDVYGRLLARYIGNHIPGTPAVIPQNMPGAGGIRATNYMANNAPKDGTVIALVHSDMTTASLFEPEKIMFNATKMTWIGNIADEMSLCLSWHDAPIKTASDMISKQFIVGGSGVGANDEIYPRVLNNVLGAKIKIISGYTGGNDLQLAMERGEVQGRCSWPLSSIRATRPDWIQNHKLNYLLQMGLERDPDLQNVPLVMDFVKTDEDREIMELIFAPRSFLRPVLAPPEIPDERVAALRAAFSAAVKDPGFLADAAKQHLTIKPKSGADMQAVIRKLHLTPKHMIDRALTAMGVK